MAGRLVSVVIPVFNGERFLGAAIESVLAQTYEPIELIVVDDESTDGSAEIAAAYEGVTLVRRRPNGGTAAARNEGIAIADGTCITFLDADDMMKPQRVERQVAAIMRGADLVLTLEEWLVERGVEKPDYLTAKRAPISGREDLWYPGSILATRETSELVGPFDESLGYGEGEDVDYLLRAFELGLKVEMLDEKLMIRRFHGGNLTYDFARVRGAVFKTLRRRIERRRSGAAPPSGTARG